MEIITFSMVIPGRTAQTKIRIRKWQRNPLKGWKLLFFSNLVEAVENKGKKLKFAKKINYKISAYM